MFFHFPKPYTLILVLVFKFACLGNCIETPEPDHQKSVILLDYLYLNQIGCVYPHLDTSSGNKEIEICMMDYFHECNRNIFESKMINLRSELLNGLIDISNDIDQCVIDVFREVQFLRSLQDSGHPYLAKENLNLNPELDPYSNLNCSTFNDKDKLISYSNREYILKPQVYLYVFAENEICRMLLHLSNEERELATSIQEKEKLIFTKNQN